MAPPIQLEGAGQWDDLLFLLHQTWLSPPLTKSNFVREWTDVIAHAASRGFITTEIAEGLREYGRYWKVTLEGLQYMRSHFHEMSDEAIKEIITGEYQNRNHNGEPGEGDVGV